MNQRLSTIYDYASLRLHRDGTRVQQSDENYCIPRRKRFAVKNASGNWIATDAAGLGTVRRTRYVRQSTDEESDYTSLENEEMEVEKKRERLIVENERKRRRVGYRTEKKRRFDENLDFLDAAHVTYSTLTQESCLPVPPSELLKSIHYLTASFYTGRGELLDLSKKSRQERQLKGKEECCNPRDSPANGSMPKPRTPHRLARTLRNIRRKHRQNMYKVMDGSALIALGMLVQEHVARLVEGQMPD